MAHHDISRRRNNSIALGAKRTWPDSHLQSCAQFGRSLVPLLATSSAGTSPSRGYFRKRRGGEKCRAARRRIIAMSKSKDDLSPQEWQARHDAACAIVARKYCDLFGFWRDCRYKPCRSARRCSGDQAPVCRAARRAFPTKPAFPRTIGCWPKRPQTPTALRAPRTAMSTVRSACTKQRVRRCEPRCERRCGNDQSRRRVLPFAAGCATRRPT